ncbi:uncharacterized protein LOC144445305 [Glandiceps talaboti]
MSEGGEFVGDNPEHASAVSERLQELDRVKEFCYLGDTLDGAGGSELAVTKRVGLGWRKFRDLESILCGCRLTLAMKGRIYKACVRPVMTYAAETWVMRAVEEGILRRAERAMVRKICGVKLSDRVGSGVLMERLGLGESIVEVARRSSLRWCGHVLRKDEGEGVKRAWNLEVDGKRGRGRPKLTWRSMVEGQCKQIGLNINDYGNRQRWRNVIATWKEGQSVTPRQGEEIDFN